MHFDDENGENMDIEDTPNLEEVSGNEPTVSSNSTRRVNLHQPCKSGDHLE